jgi:gliding motility-associated-like protein
MKIFLNYMFFTMLFVTSSMISFASHVPGGNITYECLGNNQYKIILTMYEDCGSAFIGDFGSLDEDIDINSDCGHSLSLTLTNTIFQENISQLCPSSMAQSECNGGSLPGVYRHQWEGVITLPAQCDSWTFEFDDCCRNSSSNLVGSSSDYYFYASLNNQDAPCNSSPAITAPPIPYYCVNQPVCYNLGVVETDGDSLVYSLVEALEAPNTPVVYQGGFSGAQPINGITIDPSSGLINFTPTTQGNYVVVIKVDEYLNGVLVGSIIQDFTFEIANCANQIISCSNSSISNVNGSVTQINPTTLEMCEGVPFSFDLEFTDPDPADSLFIISNINTVLPGSVTNITYPNSPSADVIRMNISWTPPPGSSLNNNAFTVTVRDNACPVSGQQTLVYNIDVIGSTFAGLDLTICESDSITLNASNGSVFNWYGVSGEPINVGTNFSCTNCPSPTINPSVTSVYEVVSDLSGNCVNRDTITVNVAPNFTYTMNQSSASSCLNSEIQLEVIPDTPNNYTYLWSPSSDIDSPTISNPVFIPTSPGTYNYAVEVSTPLGCVKYDTIEINVIAEYAPVLTVTQNVTVLNCLDSAIIDVSLGDGIPGVSGPSAQPPTPPTTQLVVGTNTGNTNSAYTYPAPFGNYYRNAKHQFLFLASELQGAGFSGGVFTEIDFEVTNLNNSTTNYNGYTIKMKGTNTTSLTTWETGLTTVFAPQNITIANGWNILPFTTAYDWDGMSNIVVEVCYDNLSTPFTQNASTPIMTTPFTSTLYYRSDATAACPYTGNPTSTDDRPLIRFGMISAEPDPADFTFDFSPSPMTQYNDPLNFYDNPTTSTDYQLVVTNIAGGCSDTADFSFGFECLLPKPRIEIPTCNGSSDGSIIVSAFGNDGPPWNIELLDDLGNSISVVPNVMDSTTFTNITAGQYLVRVTDTAGLQADSLITVLEPSPIVLSLGNDTTVCIGGSANLYGSVTGGNGVNSYVYNWSGVAGTSDSEIVQPQANTVYDVYVLDSLSCSSDTLSMSVDLFTPIISSTEITDTVCPGDVANIEANANGGHGGVYFYEWFDASGTLLGNGSNINVTPAISPSTYYVQVTDDCETPMALDSVIVHWYIEPHVDFDANIYEGCFPILVNFSNLTPAYEVGTLDWNFGDGATAVNDPNPVHAYTYPGVYDVSLTVVSPEGCVNDTTIVGFIETFDYPVADYSPFPNPANIFEPEVQFTNSSSIDATGFEWFFKDSTSIIGTSIIESPNYEFSSQFPGVYPVTLIVTNDDGCQDSITQEIIVNGVYSFYVPTAFSPNDDQVNDLFLPQGEGIESSDYSITIFNRDGAVVFTSSNPNQAWDGTHLGKKAKQDVYIWRIKTQDLFTGDFHEYFGYVTLIK